MVRKMGASDWAIQVYYSIFTQFQNTKSADSFQIFLNSPLLTVNDAGFFNSDIIITEYLNQFEKKSSTLNLWKDSHCLEVTEILDNIPYFRKLIYEAKKKLNQKELVLDDMIELLFSELKKISHREILELDDSLVYFKEKIRYELFRMLVIEEDYLKAVRIIVDSFFDNQINFIAYDSTSLKNQIYQMRESDQLLSNIDILIFMELINSEKTSYYFENFLLLNDAIKPSDLNQIDVNDNRLIYFFENVCNLNILMDQVLSFDSYEEVEEERLSILRKLIKINSSKESMYTEEISKILQDKLLKSLIKKVNQSKLFVDVNRIWNEKKESISESIQRFLSADTIKVRYYNLNIQEVSLEELTNKSNTDIAYMSYEAPKEKELKNVLSEVLDYFVTNNEYGLDTYLSTRIRHGTLQGQLRSPFQKHNLITTRKSDKSDEYLENELMINEIGGDTKFVNKAFSDFSLRIDSLIEDVKSNWMQIKKLDKTPEGMFNYLDIESSFSELYVDVENENNSKFIFDIIIQFLWDETEKSLEKIRSRLNSELCDEFIRLLDHLQESLLQNNHGNNTVVNRKISQCKTEVQLSIAEAASWFERVDPSDDMKVNSLELVELCKKIREDISTDFHTVAFSAECSDEISLSGRELPFYVDIILILIDNAIKHCNLPLNELNIKINMKIINDQIQILAENSFNQTRSKEVSDAIKGIEEKIEQSRKKATDLVKVEGGSGYSKIYKTIKYDLQKNPLIELSIKDNYFQSRICLGGVEG